MWNFKTRYTKLDCPYGKNLWNLNYFFQYCVIEESQASEAEKFDFSENEAIKFWESKVKTDYKTSLNWAHFLKLMEHGGKMATFRKRL